MKDMTIKLEIYTKDDEKYVHISSHNSTGCKYKINTPEDIGNHITEYIKDQNMEN